MFFGFFLGVNVPGVGRIEVFQPEVFSVLHAVGFFQLRYLHISKSLHRRAALKLRRGWASFE
jgi:hypothetical protein